MCVLSFTHIFDVVAIMLYQAQFAFYINNHIREAFQETLRG